MAPSPSILFDPTPELTSALIVAISDPSISFNQLAAAANTSPEALSAWITRPDIRERIESVDRGTTWRTRLIASTHLYAVPPALTKILQDFTDHKRALSASSVPAESSDETTTFRAALLEARKAETARKSAVLLISISRQRPTVGPDLAPHENTSKADPTAEAAPSPRSEVPSADSLHDLLDRLAPQLEALAADQRRAPTAPQEPHRSDSRREITTPGSSAGAPPQDDYPDPPHDAQAASDSNLSAANVPDHNPSGIALPASALKFQISDCASASPIAASASEHWP